MEEGMSALAEFIAKCTVLISTPQHPRLGTGFFVAARTVLTCAHVAKDVRDSCHLANLTYAGNAIVSWTHRSLDLAVLTLSEGSPDAEFIALLEQGEPPPPERVIGFGYGTNKLELTGAGFAADYDGLWEGGQGLKLRGTNIPRGVSGAPIIAESGAVCAVMTHTRDKRSAAGGYAVRTRVLKDGAQAVLSANAKYHERSNPWLAAMSEKQRSLTGKGHLAAPLRIGVGRFDESRQKAFSLVFGWADVRVEDIYIEPPFAVHEADAIVTTAGSLLDSVLAMLRALPLLLVTGGYGSGKTMLCKRVVAELQQAGFDAVFVSAARLAGARDIDHLIADRKQIGAPLYLVVDGCDDLAHLTDANWKGVQYFLDQLLTAAMQGGIQILASTRLPRSRGMEFMRGIKDSYELAFENVTPRWIALRPFATSHMVTWLDAYYSRGRNVDGPRLFVEDLKIPHRSFRPACSNPLFLHLAADYYSTQPNGWENAAVVYMIYQRFVDATVQGKVAANDLEAGAHSLGGFAHNYEQFLVTIAGLVLRIGVDDHDGDDVLLDDNASRYWVALELVDAATKSLFSTLADAHEAMQPGDSVAARATLLSCYFFSVVDARVSFKDNNIVFFLAARTLWKALRPATRGSSIELEQLVNVLRQMPLQALSLEMLLSCVDNLSAPERTSLTNVFQRHLQDGDIAQLGPERLARFDMAHVALDLMTIAILLRCGSLSTSQCKFVFRRIDCYLTLAKHNRKHLVTVIKRLGRAARIHGAAWRRMNFGDFDFSHARLRDLQFHLCQFKGTRFKDATLTGVLFKNCSLRETDLEVNSGRIDFQHCEIDELNIDIRPVGKAPPPELHFKRCYIKQLRLRGTDRHCVISLYTSYSHVDQLWFERIRHSSWTTQETTLVRIELIGAQVRLEIQGRDVPLPGANCDGNSVLDSERGRRTQASAPAPRQSRPAPPPTSIALATKLVPQQDSLNPILRLIQLLSGSHRVDERSMNLSDRHIAYVKHAAGLLGLIDGASHLRWHGVLVASLAGKRATHYLLHRFMLTTAFREWLRWSGITNPGELDPSSARAFLEASGLVDSMAKRRGDTLQSWARQLLSSLPDSPSGFVPDPWDDDASPQPDPVRNLSEPADPDFD
jgi:uncharacterized protein YjbI with pentapeptide repeats